jgi:hypothetical protein
LILIDDEISSDPKAPYRADILPFFLPRTTSLPSPSFLSGAVVVADKSPFFLLIAMDASR